MTAHKRFLQFEVRTVAVKTNWRFCSIPPRPDESIWATMNVNGNAQSTIPIIASMKDT